MFSVRNENTNQWVEWQSRSYTSKVSSWFVLVVSFLRGKKEYCSFHSNRDGAEEWVGVGWQSGSEVEEEKQSLRLKHYLRSEWNYAEEESVNRGQTACCLYSSAVYIHSFILQPCFPLLLFPGGGANTPAAWLSPPITPPPPPPISFYSRIRQLQSRLTRHYRARDLKIASWHF